MLITGCSPDLKGGRACCGGMSFGFEPVSDRYLEDGIAHLDMRLPAAAPAGR